MEIEKTEQEMEEYLSKNLNIIEPGLGLIKRQFKTKYGKIDLLCWDQEGNRVAVEIKKYPNTNSPGQLAKYVYALKQEFPRTLVRGILVSPKLSKEICELCNYFYLNFKEVHDVDFFFPTIYVHNLFSKNQNLN